MRQLSPRTCLLTSGAIAGALLGNDLLRLAISRRLPPGELRNTALSAAALLAAVGLSTRHTTATLDLARRIERARHAGRREGRVVRLPTPVASD